MRSTKSAEKKLAYMREWRKSHPNYHKNYRKSNPGYDFNRRNFHKSYYELTRNLLLQRDGDGWGKRHPKVTKFILPRLYYTT